MKSQLNIVKVQVPLFSSKEQQQALIYNENHVVDILTPVENVLDIMGGEPKKYFYFKRKKDGEVILLGEAPWQEW